LRREFDIGHGVLPATAINWLVTLASDQQNGCNGNTAFRSIKDPGALQPTLYIAYRHMPIRRTLLNAG
jgi:hypothetical protein